MSSSSHDAPVPPKSGPYEVIDHLLHPTAAEIRSLLSPGQGTDTTRILIDDEENILQALANQVNLHALFFSGDNPLPPALLTQAADLRIPIYEVARRTCKKLFDKERASRIFAIAKRPDPKPLAVLERGTQDIIVLDHLTLQGNIGAIIRNAVAFDIGAIVLLGASEHATYDRRLIRSSRGHVFTLPIIATSTPLFLAFATTHDIRMVATSGKAPISVNEGLDPFADKRLAVVFGSETSGCSSEVLEHITTHVRIPMNPRVQSLNVSAACAIVMHQRFTFNRRDA